MKRLMITCDDCGMSEGIDDASAALHEHGQATAVSIMANLPATQHALSLFASYPALEKGIHLNLTDGYPLTTQSRSSPLTGPDGRFHSRRGLFARALAGPPSYIQQVEAELAAQIEQLLAAGIHPQHVTTHLHFHTLPPLRRVVLRLALRYNIPTMRAYGFAANLAPHHGLLSRLLSAGPRPNGRPGLMSDYVVGIKWWLDRNPGALASALMYLDGTVEMIVHPSVASDPTFPARVRYKPAQRAAETAYLQAVLGMLEHLTERS